MAENKKIWVQVNQSTINSSNADLLMCEVKDFIEENKECTERTHYKE